jgi:hypothetical protein
MARRERHRRSRCSATFAGSSGSHSRYREAAVYSPSTLASEFVEGLIINRPGHLGSPSCTAGRDRIKGWMRSGRKYTAILDGWAIGERGLKQEHDSREGEDLARHLNLLPNALSPGSQIITYVSITLRERTVRLGGCRRRPTGIENVGHRVLKSGLKNRRPLACHWPAHPQLPSQTCPNYFRHFGCPATRTRRSAQSVLSLGVARDWRLTERSGRP